MRFKRIWPKFLFPTLLTIFLITTFLTLPTQVLAVPGGTRPIGAHGADDGSISADVDCDSELVRINFRLKGDPSVIERMRIEIDDRPNPADERDGLFDPNRGFRSELAIDVLPAHPAANTSFSGGTYSTTLAGFGKNQDYWYRIITHVNLARDQSHGGLSPSNGYHGYTGTDPHTGPDPARFDGGRIWSDSSTTHRFTFCGPPGKPGGPGPARLCEIPVYFARILAIISSIFAFGLLAMLIVGGIRYLTSGGDPKTTAAARNIMTYAIIGIILMFVAWIILLAIQFIFQPSPSILNFRFCL